MHPCWANTVAGWVRTVAGWVHAVAGWVRTVADWVHAVAGWVRRLVRTVAGARCSSSATPRRTLGASRSLFAAPTMATPARSRRRSWQRQSSAGLGLCDGIEND